MTERDVLHDVIRIAYNAQHGIKESKQPFDANALLKMAEKQNVYPLVHYGIGELCFEQKAYKLTNRQLGATYFVRKIAYLDVIAELESLGIRTILLKGYSCSRKYKEEYLRVSSDCDLFILEEDEGAAQQILEKKGFRCTEVRQEHQHHSVWIHDDVGICELHTKFVEDDIDYVWESTFKEKELIEKRIRVDTEEGYFFRLPPVEEWVFLFVHTLKHFLQTGLSIQMLLDLYVSYNGLEDIHAQKALRLITTSDFGALWKVFYEYIQKYGAGENVTEHSEALEMITQDLLHSGWMGLKENTRRASLYDASNKRELPLRIWLHKVKTVLRRIIPERKIMERRYPVLIGKPWLFPYIYIARFGAKMLQRVWPSEKIKWMQKCAKLQKQNVCS